jgi:hypothetical protein
MIEASAVTFTVVASAEIEIRKGCCTTLPISMPTPRWFSAPNPGAWPVRRIGACYYQANN